MVSPKRVWILLRARLKATGGTSEGAAALLLQAALTALFCGLVRDELPPFPYGLFSLSLAGALVALPLLGELGGLLRRDEAATWVEALAIRPAEVRLARTGTLLCLLAAQALASGIPAALLAPGAMGWPGRLALPFLTLGLAIGLAATLLSIQSLLGGRAEALLVLIQTLLVVGLVFGGIAGLQAVDQLARLPYLGDPYAPFLWFVPPAWFAAPLGPERGSWALLPLALTVLALGILLWIPAPARRAARRAPLLDRLLHPVRLLALRFWVRREERGMFELVADALPREREVVLRTYPMLGIPLAFGALSATGGSDERGDLLAILLFTVGTYLPVLLTHVPATDSARASWIHTTAPVAPRDVSEAAIKALALRFLVPLYVVLGSLTLVLRGPWFTLRLVLPAYLVTLLVLRRLYRVCVTAPPLSVSPDEVETNQDWISILAGVALGLTLVAVAVNVWFVTPLSVALLCAALIAMELRAERAR